MCNKKMIAALLAACILPVAACGSTVTTGNEPLEDAVYNDDYISLAPYLGLEGEKKKYKVTQTAIDSEIHAQLEEYAEYKSVDRASADGDWVYADYSIFIDGDVYMESYDENSYFVIGDEEYGEEFDQKLTGVSAGDELEFTITYDKEYIDVDLAGNTVDFKIAVNDVKEEIMPDCTDEFVQENLGYDSYDDFAAAAAQTIADSYESDSINDLKSDLLQQVIDNSSILKYEKKDYDDIYKSVIAGYESYAEMFGTDLESIYKMFEITDESLKEETLDTLYRNLVIDAIAKKEGLTISDEEYEEGVASYVEMYEYNTIEEFQQDYSEEDIRATLLDDKVMQLLMDHAQTTEVEADYEEY